MPGQNCPALYGMHRLQEVEDLGSLTLEEPPALLPAFQAQAAAAALARPQEPSMCSRLTRGNETWAQKSLEWERGHRPGPSLELLRRQCLAPLGLGYGTHQPVARACRSGPPTGA